MSLTKYPLPTPLVPSGTSKTLTELTLREARDNRALKQVLVSFWEGFYPRVLWDTPQYDTVGQWTDEQLDTDITQAISANPQAFVDSLFVRPQTNLSPSLSKELYGVIYPRTNIPFPFPQAAAPVAAVQSPTSR